MERMAEIAIKLRQLSTRLTGRMMIHEYLAMKQVVTASEFQDCTKNLVMVMELSIFMRYRRFWKLSKHLKEDRHDEITDKFEEAIKKLL
jgi:hypothetical protein